jgi:hypothetical protein
MAILGLNRLDSSGTDQDLTLAPSGDGLLISTRTLSVTGAITSTGSQTGTSFTATSNTGVRRNVEDGSLRIYGGNDTSLGGQIWLYGDSEPNTPNRILIRQGTTTRIEINTAGRITLTAGGTNENIQLTPSGTGTVNAPTFNATSTVAGGFQGIAADSVSLPSFTWTSDLDTGIYRVGSDRIGFTAGGVQVSQFDRLGTSSRRRLFFLGTTEIEVSVGSLFLEATTDVRSITTANVTTAAAANMVIGSTNGLLQRSTSSIKYKTEVEESESRFSETLVYQSEPVWYRSLCENDPKEWSYWGFIAEEVAQLDPRMVHWGGENNDEPEGVQYDRYVVHLVKVAQMQKQRIDTLESRIAALEDSQS